MRHSCASGCVCFSLRQHRSSASVLLAGAAFWRCLARSCWALWSCWFAYVASFMAVRSAVRSSDGDLFVRRVVWLCQRHAHTSDTSINKFDMTRTSHQRAVPERRKLPESAAADTTGRMMPRTCAKKFLQAPATRNYNKGMSRTHPQT